jgi:hypothetical protein
MGGHQRRYKHVVTAGLVSAGLMLASGTAMAAARPDLVVTAVTISVHRVTAGHGLTVADTTKGTGRAKATSTGYYLSRDK